MNIRNEGKPLHRLQMITFIVLAAVVVLATRAWGQIVTSSVSGTVVDALHAAIPEAQVTVRGPQGDILRNVKTNGNGFFQIIDLQPGTYSIKVARKDFGAVQEPNIIVSAAKDLSLGEIVLRPGEVDEVVTVNSVTNGVDTESPNNESRLSTEELEKIRMRSNDIMEALTLLPGNTDNASGSRDAPNSNSVANIYTNGVRSNSKNIMIDGVASMDPLSGANVNTLPSIPMVQELKLTATNFRADSGRNAGPSVIIITKSGSQVVHGDFDFPFRNEFFNANSPDDKRPGINLPRPKYRLLLPSYTLTGPLVIRHLISPQRHLFFTVSQQLQIQTNDPFPQTKFQTMPTAAERMGDFSSSVYGNSGGNGATVQVSGVSWCGAENLKVNCVGTHIPSQYLTPQGLAILNLFPLPNHAPAFTGNAAVNGASAYNYMSTSAQITHRNTNLVRVDWQPSTRFSMYARGLYTPETAEAGWNANNSSNQGYSNLGWFDGDFAQRSIGTGGLVNLTNTFSSSLVNTIGLSISTRESHGYAENPNSVSAANLSTPLPALFPNADPLNFLPNIGFGCQNNPTQVSCANGNPFNDSNLPSYSLDASFPGRTHSHLFSITDNLTKVLGTHSLVAGLYFEEAHVNSLATGIFSSGLNNRGSYSFMPEGANLCDSRNTPAGIPGVTGSPFANILLGCIDSYTQASARPEMYGRFHNVEVYLQDEWKATSRLTLSGGLRFYHDPPAADAHNQLYDFVPSMYQPSLAPRLWRPAAGRVAIDPATGTMAPSGFAGFYVAGSSPLPNPELNGLVRVGTNGIPNSVFTAPFLSYGPRVGFNWAMTRDGKTILKGGFGIYFDRFPLQDQLNLLSNPPASSVEGIDDINGFSQLAGLVGQTSPPSLSSFPLGQHPLPTNHGYSLEIQRQISRDGTLGAAYVGNVSQHLVATQNINNQPLYSQLHSLSPQNVDPSTGNTMLSSLFLVPYQGFASIQQEFLGGSSNYNSLQISYAQKLLNRHVQLRANYTWGHTLGYASEDNFHVASQPEPLNFYGPLNYDRRNLANFWYIVDFPDPGRLADSRFLSILGRNWSASGVYRFSTGSPFTPSLYTSGVQYAGGSGPVSTSSQTITGSQDGARPVLLNPRAKLMPGDSNNKFAGPNLGTWGNTGNAEFNLPHWDQFDLTLYRTFHTTSRLQTTFRTEIYNVPNSTLISGLNTILGYNYCVTNATGTCQTYLQSAAGGNQNKAFFTAQTSDGLNSSTTNFYRPGRVIQFDISGRF